MNSQESNRRHATFVDVIVVDASREHIRNKLTGARGIPRDGFSLLCVWVGRARVGTEDGEWGSFLRRGVATPFLVSDRFQLTLSTRR